MQINGIQFLRFVAVFLVLGSHAVLEMWRRLGNDGSYHFWHEYGGSGVDLFFVISGFVITISTVKAAGSGGAAAAWLFCKRRIIRIVPMYWLYTGLKVALILAIGSKTFEAGLEPGFVLASLLFWPTTNPVGAHLPVLESGWTLSYEMLFYATFAIAIWRRWPPLRFSLAALGVIFVLGQFEGSPLFLTFFARSLLFEFLLGGLIARLWVRRIAMPAPLPPLMLAAAVLLLFVVPMPAGADRLLAVGLPCALLVASAVWLERYDWISRGAAHFKLLGDASYSIYLSHGLLMPPIVIVLLKMGVQHKALVFGAAVGGSLLIGCVLYLWLEKPLTDMLNRRYSAAKGAKAAGTAA